MALVKCFKWIVSGMGTLNLMRVTGWRLHLEVAVLVKKVYVDLTEGALLLVN